MTYSYVQRDLAEVLLNSTEPTFDRPFYWDSDTEETVQEKKIKKKRVICSEDTFKFQHLSYRKAVQKPFFFEVNASGDDNTSTLDSCVWSVISARRR
jgi:hypothetical protein